MNKLIYIAAFVLITGLYSCENDAFKDNIGYGESINDFELASPANFSSLLINEAQSERTIEFEWNAAVSGLGGTVTYIIMLDEKGEDFSSPLLSMISADDGTQNNLSISYEDLLVAIAGSTGTDFVWSVEATVNNEKGVNSLLAKNAFEISITESTEGLADFIYDQPTLNEKLIFDKFKTPDELIEFVWTKSTSLSGDPVHYSIQFDDPEGDFSAPLLEYDSDDNGVDTVFSITHKDLTEALLTITYEDGLNWRVIAKVGEFTYSPGAQYVRFEAAGAGPENLYLVGGSTTAGWSPENSIPFVNLEEGKWEVYANLDPAGGGFKFLEIKDWPGDWGMSPGNPGVLAQEGEDNVTIPTLGFYRIFVDFTTGTYTTQEIQWGIIGSATPNGWGDPDVDMTYDGSAGNLYTWYAQNVTLIDGEIKFRANDGWDINYGDNDANGSLEPGGANIAVTAGNYLIKLILDPESGFTYKVISGPSNLYLVGGSTVADWNPANAVPFINKGDGTFEIYSYLDVAGGGFKFLEVMDWAGDWGMSPGNPGVLEQDTEENVTVPSDGFYRVTVDFNAGTYEVLATNWAIIGSATPNGWNDPDTDMALSSATKGNYSWTIDVTLTDGELKFRANDGWDINYGDTGADGTLEAGGDNIAVSAGTYTIVLSLDPVNGYTYSIN